MFKILFTLIIEFFGSLSDFTLAANVSLASVALGEKLDSFKEITSYCSYPLEMLFEGGNSLKRQWLTETSHSGLEM